MTALPERTGDPARPAPCPDLAWDPARARRFADRAVDLWQELLEHLPHLLIATGADHDRVMRAVTRAVPDDPLPDDELFAHLEQVLLEWSVLPGHPRFMAYISGASTAPGAVADLLASGVNMNLGGWGCSPRRRPRSSCI